MIMVTKRLAAEFIFIWESNTKDEAERRAIEAAAELERRQKEEKERLEAEDAIDAELDSEVIILKRKIANTRDEEARILFTTEMEAIREKKNSRQKAAIRAKMKVKQDLKNEENLLAIAKAEEKAEDEKRNKGARAAKEKALEAQLEVERQDAGLRKLRRFGKRLAGDPRVGTFGNMVDNFRARPG